MMGVSMIERKSLVIYFDDINMVKGLRKDIRVQYASAKSNYAIIYFNLKHEKEVLKYLDEQKWIKSIEKSEVAYEKYAFKD